MKHTKVLAGKSALADKELVEKNEVFIKKNNRKIQELRKALAYAEAIVTAIPTPLIILYPSFQVRTANKAFYQTFKVSPEETEGKLIYTLANGQWNIPILKTLLEEILPGKKALDNFEVDHFFPDIGRKTMVLNARRLMVKNKFDPMVLLAIEDVTEKKSVEDAVEKEQKIILENIPGGLMTLDKEWRITYGNKKIEAIIEKKLIDIAGRNIWKVLPSLVGTSFDKNCCKTFKTGVHVAFEQFFPKINCWFCIEAFSSPDGLSIYFVDITKHKQAEEVIELQRQKMFNLLMNAPALICVLRGPRHIYELANKPYRQMAGSKRDLIGTPIRQALPELKKQGIFKILDNVYKTGTAYIGKEVPLKITGAGSDKSADVILNFVFQPYSDPKGKVQGIISYASDITSLINKRKQIEELSRQKDEFIGIASHELKTPVTSIKGYTQILQMRFSQEGNTRAVELLARMDSQINKLTNLIGDLLDATKIEGGKLQYHHSSFDFNELVQETAQDMQQIASRHTITLKLALTTHINGDRDRIGQVIVNLISNAVKYSPGKREVIVSTSKAKNTITLSVQDFGIGIPEQKQQKVFDRFYRVSGDKEDTFPGMGLGLYISAEIIRRHQGEISVKSILGKGSIFSFSLPVAGARVRNQAAEI